jgi:hypothetical protein
VFATERKVIAGFSMMGQRPTQRTQLLHCNRSLVGALLGVAFSHRDILDLTRQTSFYGDFSKKKFIQITDEAWRN